ncbi:shikimate dehydrogenase family protein [Nanoarchaeota archaeon]
MIQSNKSIITGLIGENPSTYSKSRIMWNFCFNILGIDAEYQTWDVHKFDLKDFLEELKSNEKVRGFNITNPYKDDSILFFENIDDAALAIGGINTVVKRDKTKAYSTDGYGALKCFTEQGIEIKNSNLVVLGAGGAGSAIAVEAVKQGANVTIINRTHDKTLKLKDRIQEFLHKNIVAVPLYQDKTYTNLSEKIKDIISNANIIINTIDFEKRFEKELFPESYYKTENKLSIMDAVYGHKSYILEYANKFNHKIIPGENMLVHQAVLGFHYMFDTEMETVEKLMKYAINKFDFKTPNEEIDKEAEEYKKSH